MAYFKIIGIWMSQLWKCYTLSAIIQYIIIMMKLLISYKKKKKIIFNATIKKHKKNE